MLFLKDKKKTIAQEESEKKMFKLRLFLNSLMQAMMKLKILLQNIPKMLSKKASESNVGTGETKDQAENVSEAAVGSY